MKKTAILTIIAVASIFFLVQSGIANALLLFLLVGAIPGTQYSVPSNVMFLSISGLSWLIVLRFTVVEAFLAYVNRRTTKPALDHKKRMPRRRFSEI
jgi:predicted membrane protein